MRICLVIVDADMTVWNHPDLSSLTLPFKKVDKNSLIDAKGEGLRLFDGTRYLLKGAEGELHQTVEKTNHHPRITVRFFR